MSDLCLHCGEHLAPTWIFCARCGAHIPMAAAAPKPENPAPEPGPWTGAFGGLYFGLIAVPILLIVGIMLCCTGLGAILGIPMIIAAILAPLAGPIFGMGAAKGKVL